jgi:hypothetical protein|tara:strand:+ start:858 stop:1127 length:270 start_codon:yes stop_codon:yes gene_type:complete
MKFRDIVDWILRQIKDAPNAYTGFLVPYYLEEVIPSAKKYLYDNRETLSKLSKTELNIHMFKYITKYNVKNYPKYQLSRRAKTLLNRKD